MSNPKPGPHDSRPGQNGDYDPAHMEPCERHESPLIRGAGVFNANKGPVDTNADPGHNVSGHNQQ